jgi:uncharacterized protein (TIGR02246 family)
MAASNPQDVHSQFEKAFNAGDVEALVALYEADARLVPQPGQVITGQAAIREALQGFLSLKGRIKLETTHAIEAGDVALLRGQWSLTGTGADGQPIAMGANSSEVVRRQADGRWLYLIDHPYGAD